MPFTTLGLSDAISHPLSRMGYGQPTPVQTQSIPIVLSGSDLLARAQTGTGKTAAFALPMIERLLAQRHRQASSRAPRGLVLVPTRELASQVHRAFANTALRPTFGSLRSTEVCRCGRRREALRKGVDIVVATPGRLIDHLQQGAIDLSTIEILTLDEADRMLDMGFLP